MRRKYTAVKTEVFVDHTTLHSMWRGPLGTAQLKLRALELLQFIEHLLLSDVIWFSDLPKGECWDISSTIRDLLSEFGLSDSRGEAKVRVAHLTFVQHKEAVQSAARTVYHTVDGMNASDLRRCAGRTRHVLTPRGALPLDFPSIKGIEYGSREAQDFVDSGLDECEWEGTLAPVFFDPSLYSWTQKLIQQAPDPSDDAHMQLQTILRWRINEELAQRVRPATQMPVFYCPAIGRGETIGAHAQCAWNKIRAQLEQQLGGTISRFASQPDWDRLMFTLSPERRIEAPLFAIWLVTRLQDGCTIKHLLEEVVNALEDDRVRAMRDWLRHSGDLGDIDAICREIATELARGGSGVEGRKLGLHKAWVTIAPVIWIDTFREIV